MYMVNKLFPLSTTTTVVAVVTTEEGLGSNFGGSLPLVWTLSPDAGRRYDNW